MIHVDTGWEITKEFVLMWHGVHLYGHNGYGIELNVCTRILVQYERKEKIDHNL